MNATLIIFYIFFGGCGGGLLFVISLVSLYFHAGENRTTEMTKDFILIKRFCYLIGLAVIVFAAFCLIADLGRPTRAWTLFFSSSLSILNFGFFVLLLTIILAFFLTLVNYLDSTRVSSKIKKLAEILCMVFSVLLVSYTGVYLFSIRAIELWSNYAIPFLIILSSLSAGFSLFFLISPLVRGFAWLKDQVNIFFIVHGALVILEAIVLAVFFYLAQSNPYADASLAVLLGPKYLPWVIIGIIVFGLICPLVSEALVVVLRRESRVFVLDALCLVGSFCLRYAIVSSGMQ